GASGALRQEFRELELLDEITGLRFEGTLPSNVSGLTRNELIAAYQKYRGETYVSQHMHVALRWNKATPWLAPEPIPDIPSTNRADRHKNLKRKTFHDEALSIRRGTAKRNRLLNGSNNVDSVAPIGLVWQNNSCAYDCVLTILCQVWREDVDLWSNMFAEVNTDWMGRLSNMLRRYTAGLTSFENVRDELRRKYAILDPVHMQYGLFTYVGKVLQPLFLNDRPVRSLIIVCSRSQCGLE
ncbi:hypothetical protein ARMGADRAFT_935961, partial [Armillaria gallica]